VGTLDAGSSAAVEALFESQYAGCQLQDARGNLPDIRSFMASCPHVGVVTGMPTPNWRGHGRTGTQVDRLIRGLYRTRWALLVLAEPVDDSVLVERQIAILREQVRVDQEEAIRERRESAGQTVAEYYFRLLDRQSKFLEYCLSEGGWLVQSYICSPDPADYNKTKALIKCAFSGELSDIDRIRVLDGGAIGLKAASFSWMMAERPPAPSLELLPGAGERAKYRTLVSSGQLSALIHLPRVEMPGYYVRESATFDVSSHVPANVQSIQVGEILDRGRPTGNDYRVPVRDLTKHCLLVGITGSGKTNTMKHLIQQIEQREPPTPFLVIEPAKREYRRLLSGAGRGKELCVFTVGEEGEDAAPFRLNPFEIRPGVAVQTHIDLLKSVFNASFGMWTPLPQVLERAIHEIYRDRGWNPVHSTNDRAAIEGAGGMSWHSRAQPTLSDLYHKVDELVPKLGYDKEVSRNVRTALETRINSLRVGAKGMMLDTQNSIPIEHLLARPTILELEGVGDDDEKAFVMGLVLIALYEYYRSHGSPTDSSVRHVTIIEEAHRLLTNVPASTDPEASNLRGKAVETFVNMLSEVRAYGEGFMIAEQIPTKLSPDVIKNTALKIMHRVVASDDRQVMGGAMNLDPSQLRQVVALGTGEAIVHGGGRYGDDNAMLIKVKRAERDGLRAPTDREVREAWERFRDQYNLHTVFVPYPTCHRHCGQGNVRCADAREIAEDGEVEEAFARFVLSLVAGSLSRSEHELVALLQALYPALCSEVRARISGLREDLDQTRCILTHSLYRYLDSRSAQYGWRYTTAAKMVGQLLPAVLTVAADQKIKGDARAKLQAFCEAYATNCRLGFEPFYGCSETCGRPSLCLYRYSIETLLQDGILTEQFAEAGDDWAQMVEVCESAAERMIALPAGGASSERAMDAESVRTAALCFAVQKTHSDPSAWTTKNREFVIDQLLAHYGRRS
jgi:hypothetical protein